MSSSGTGNTSRPAPATTGTRNNNSTTRHKRPLSAIFLGDPAQLPDLPDPPSTASSPSSGLPSPPASNSTGSGSNGGDLSNESVRVPVSLMKNSSNGAGGGTRSRSFSRSSSDDGDGADDEDHTARLSGGPPTSRTNVMDSNETALQRVKSLTQRNRLVLSKLASLSTSGTRLASPSPTAVSRRSPAPPTTNSVSSSSRLTRRRSETMSHASGSETERENANNGASDSEGLSETPTSVAGSHFRSTSMAERRPSALDDSKHAAAERPGRGRTVEFSDEAIRQSRPQSRAETVEAAALAAVAQARQESPVETRRRQPLPREFLGNDSIGHPPQTPRRERTTSGTYSAQDSPSSSKATLHDSPMTPRTRASRFSSIRDITRRNQSRWLSQDLSPLKHGVTAEGDSPTRRLDFGDSPRRNFVGESLRAAGLVKLREENEDVFGGADANRRLRISSDVGVRPSESRLDNSSRPGTRFSERPVAFDTERYVEPRTPANAPYSVARRNVQTSVKPERPSTSLEKYRDEPQTAPPALRSYRSTYAAPESERDRQPVGDLTSRPSSELRRYALSSASATDRSGSSLARRHSPASPLHAASAAADGTPEHTRLMLESLGMFESQLSRLPSLGSTTTVTIPELFRSAQNIVHSADALSNMLRRGTAHALEEQIDAELGEDGRPIDLVSLWRDVGAEYRESVRVSDELVRTMTSFLLGVGKVLREATSENSHNRTLSIDDSPRRRNTPDVPTAGDGSRRSESTRLSSEGNRSSLDGKNRWMISSGETGRTQTSFTSLHSASSTTSFRPTTVSQRLAEAELGSRQSESVNDSDNRSRKPRFSVTSRLFDREALQELRGRETKANTSQDDVGAVDSSPSVAAAARQQVSAPRRSNTVSVPPSLATLPSESLLSRQTTEKAASITRRQKAISSTGRAATSIFPTLTHATEPTTAVNKTQASPERPRHTAAPSTSRTFSRTGGAAVAGLQQSIERDVRKRATSIGSVNESESRQGRNNASDANAGGRRPRMSLDSATSSTTGNSNSNAGAGTFSARTARDRRGTVTNLFVRP